MKISSMQIRVCLFLLSISGNAQALIFNFDYSLDTSGFFTTSPNARLARGLMDDAGNYFSSRITDNLDAITSSGPNHYDIHFFHPSSRKRHAIKDFSIADDTLTIFVGGSTTFAHNALGEAAWGGNQWIGTQTFANSISRGQDSISGKNANDFATWGGDITINANANWYFDDDISSDEPFTGFDFYSVALHEIAHILGFSDSDSWLNQTQDAHFLGTAAVAAHDGPVPLVKSLDHWAPGTLSTVNGKVQETAMDPDIAAGTRKHFTDLDLAALSDIGWEVQTAPVPLPPTLYLFASAIAGLTVIAKLSRYKSL